MSTAMQGVYLEFYVQEGCRHHGILAYEWLLQQARTLGIPGGTALRAIAGYGRRGQMHEDHFFELAGDLPVVVGFALAPEDAQRLLDHVGREQLAVFYIRMPADMGVTGSST